MKLMPHPDFGFPKGVSVYAALAVSNEGDFEVQCSLAFTPKAISLPDQAMAQRADDLWKTTCFELFLGVADSPGYSEFNFSPSGQWAAYAFDGYRSGMRDFELRTPPTLKIERGDTRVNLTAQLIGLGEMFGSQAVEASLTAVVEAKDGTKSYWALAHPEGPPDFHHRDCFALQLAPPGNS